MPSLNIDVKIQLLTPPPMILDTFLPPDWNISLLMPGFLVFMKYQESSTKLIHISRTELLFLQPFLSSFLNYVTSEEFYAVFTDREPPLGRYVYFVGFRIKFDRCTMPPHGGVIT